jgi:glutaminyl-tRNA synthetase
VKNIAELRWANTLEVKNTVEKVFNAKFGAKEAAKPKGKVCASWALLGSL